MYNIYLNILQLAALLRFIHNIQRYELLHLSVNGNLRKSCKSNFLCHKATEIHQLLKLHEVKFLSIQ